MKTHRSAQGEIPFRSEICARLIDHQEEILENLTRKTFLDYRWLQVHLQERNVAEDEQYRRKFSHYYQMRFVSQEYKQAFFTLFESLKTDPQPFETIAKTLYPVEQKHELSFISKMLHTLDPHRPIYDSHVCKVLHLHRANSGDFDHRIAQDRQVLEYIAQVYQEMDASPEIQTIIDRMNRWTPDYQVSKEKRYDFLLWSYGALLLKAEKAS